MVDSGASQCIFHSSLGRAVGLIVEKFEAERTVGVSGQPTRICMHDVSLHIPGGHVLKIRAAFSDDLPLAALLGRRGFFEHFQFRLIPQDLSLDLISKESTSPRFFKPHHNQFPNFRMAI